MGGWIAQICPNNGSGGSRCSPNSRLSLFQSSQVSSGSSVGFFFSFYSNPFVLCFFIIEHLSSQKVCQLASLGLSDNHSVLESQCPADDDDGGKGECGEEKQEEEEEGRG